VDGRASIQDAATDRSTILVVEDDFDLRTAIVDRLRDAGFEARAADDGHQAIAALNLRLPAVILLDLMMPNMNGWEFLTELNKRDYRPPIPVLILTAAGNVRHIPPGHPVFVKPIDTRAIAEAITKLMAPPSGAYPAV
jgi:DNA-binding response OmpR family regulator